MRTFKFFLLLCSFCFSFMPVKSFGSVRDTLQHRVLEQLLFYPQQKLYLHLDKATYITGEDAFFRVHLVDAALHTPYYEEGHYVYVELINPLDSVVSRVMIRPLDGVYSGVVPIAETLPEGQYTIRAYTDNLRNQGSDYFFYRKINVLNYLSERNRMDYNFDIQGDKVNVEISLFDIREQKIFSPDFITIQVNNQGSSKVPVKKDGKAYFSFRLPADSKQRTLFVESLSYRKYIPIPPAATDYDLNFYPEGGYLIEGVPCMVAFKALRPDGVPASVTGKIVDEDNVECASFETMYEGMGKFSFTPQKEKKYRAFCIDQGGQEKSFELPKAQNKTHSLQIETTGEEELHISVLRPVDIEYSVPTYLLLHTRGMIHYAERWDDQYNTISFPVSNFPSGVMQILLLDEAMNPLSERLYFCLNKDQANVSSKTDQENYSYRSPVKIDMQVTGSVELPLEGSFSVSVTDDLDILPDSTTHILSTLLLSSELKGHIHHPAYYFKEGNEGALELVMLTHGWRRYNIPEALKEQYESPQYPVKPGMEVRGALKDLITRKPVKKAKVSIISPTSGYLDEGESNDTGKFVFDGFEVPDSTLFIVQGLTKKGNDKLELVLDSKEYPGTAGVTSIDLSIENSQENDLAQETVTNYIGRANARYAMENGIRMVYLDEVEVLAKRNERKEETFSFYMPTNPKDVITEKEIEEIQPIHLSDIIQRLPFVAIEENEDGQKKVYIDRMSYTFYSARALPASIIVNDQIIRNYSLDDILDPRSVERVGILKGSAATMLGGDGAGGAIVVVTKQGVPYQKPPEIYNKKRIMPLGFQPPVEFYSPKYETGAERNSVKPDLRSTIYWNPSIKVSPEGKAEIEFYTADKQTTYSVIVEGVTMDGKLICHRRKINRE